MDNFKKHFPLLKGFTYFDTAASGLLSYDLIKFRREHDMQLAHKGSFLKEEDRSLLLQTREALGRLFSCAPNRVALVSNFSSGFNTLLEMLPPSKKILLIENDYPSINAAIEMRNFETCYAGLDANLEENILNAVQENQPDILALSLVQYINGIKMDFDFLKGLKKDFPNLLIFGDGTQFCGTEFFDFDSSGLDVLGSSGYKWLNAGYGNGFFLFKENINQEISSEGLNFGPTKGKYRLNSPGFLSWFESGHKDLLNFGSLLQAVNYIRTAGMENIEKSIQKNAVSARKALEAEGLLEPNVQKREKHSSIFNIKGDDSLFNFLRKRNILCSQRGNGIRLSFSFFNTAEDLALLMQTLREGKNK